MRRGAALALVLAVACGGGHEGRDPDVWAADVCSGITAWVADLQQLSTKYGEDIGTLQLEAGNPTKVTRLVQRRTLEFIDQGLASTEQLLTEIRGSGVPAVEDGPEVVRTFERGMGEMRDAFETIREGLGNAEGPGEVQAQLARFSQIFTEAGDRIRAVFADAEERGLGGEALADAFGSEPECSGLRN